MSVIFPLGKGDDLLWKLMQEIVLNVVLTEFHCFSKEKCMCMEART